MRVAIIGGGPSGLVQLKCLREAERRFPSSETVEVRLFEADKKIGGVFHQLTYEEGELVSSKFLTSFSDFRPRADEPDFFSAERYVEYLEQYADHFGLWPYIHLNTRVRSIHRGKGGGHIITYQISNGNVKEWQCDAVAVCSGVHSAPNVPDIPGIENVPVVMHSSKFKSRSQFGKDKTVMVLGSGETAADVSYLAITAPTKQVILCHRNGWVGAPKRISAQRFLPWLFGAQAPDYPQVPLDVTQITLFDSMYVHPIVRDSMMVWAYYHMVALPLGCWLCSGATCGIDQFVGGIMGDRFHASRVFFNKAWQRISNYCSYPYRPQAESWATRIRKFFFHTEIPPPSRIIDVAPIPSHITQDGVAHFPLDGRPESERINQSVVRPDIVIQATGYVPAFPFLNTSKNVGKTPYPIAAEANVRQIWKSDDPTVGFIGFVRPGFGAIPALAEMQAMLFTMHLTGNAPHALNPDDEWHYRLIGPPSARVSYGVEHDSYAYQLAKDMDIAASFTEILKLSIHARKGWRLPYIWACGASFTSKFRLQGAWKQEDAAEILTHEMWETITRRESLWSNLTLSMIPMLYLGSISLFYWIYANLRDILAYLRLAPPLQHRILPRELIQKLGKAGNESGTSRTCSSSGCSTSK